MITSPKNFKTSSIPQQKAVEVVTKTPVSTNTSLVKAYTTNASTANGVNNHSTVNRAEIKLQPAPKQTKRSSSNELTGQQQPNLFKEDQFQSHSQMAESASGLKFGEKA